MTPEQRFWKLPLLVHLDVNVIIGRNSNEYIATIYEHLAGQEFSGIGKTRIAAIRQALKAFDQRAK
jgi:hypothetical protein